MEACDIIISSLPSWMLLLLIEMLLLRIDKLLLLRTALEGGRFANYFYSILLIRVYS